MQSSESGLSTPKAGNTGNAGSAKPFFPEVIPGELSKNGTQDGVQKLGAAAVRPASPEGSILDRLSVADCSFGCTDNSVLLSDDEGDNRALPALAASNESAHTVLREEAQKAAGRILREASSKSNISMEATLPPPKEPEHKKSDSLAYSDITLVRGSGSQVVESIVSDLAGEDLDDVPLESVGTGANCSNLPSVPRTSFDEIGATSSAHSGPSPGPSRKLERKMSRTASFFRRSSSVTGMFAVSGDDLTKLAQERTAEALADLIELRCGPACSPPGPLNSVVAAPDLEGGAAPPAARLLSEAEVRRIVSRLRDGEDAKVDAAKVEAVVLLVDVFLRSSAENGLPASPEGSELDLRRAWFGVNTIPPKSNESFCKLCWEALQDFVLIMLTVLGGIIIVVETWNGNETGWIEGVAILVAVVIVVLVTASIDYKKQGAFVRLMASLDNTNTKSAIRGGQAVTIVDADIVVGDVLNVNAHNLASVPADCVVITSEGMQLDESSLTGESRLVTKKPGDVVLSGTTVVTGGGKLVVIAVGTSSVAGKIKARVYSNSAEDGLEGDDSSPLFTKVETLAKMIGVGGMAAALTTFFGLCIKGFIIDDEKDYYKKIIEYLINAITVLAVAVPEGLPLAVTLSLAFSSNKMMSEQNLVKNLDSCETMGCATTICTDKTGTLTANKMMVRAMHINGTDYTCNDAGLEFGDFVLSASNVPNKTTLELVAQVVAIDTMNESVLHLNEDDQKPVKTIKGASGNPTECALLHMCHHFKFDYKAIRDTTRGRSAKGELAAHLCEGKQFMFTSARKMMSWAVPIEGGGYRLYSKGATEIVLSRCTSILMDGPMRGNDAETMTDETRASITKQLEIYARRGMRTLALAIRDVGPDFDLSQLEEGPSSVCNSDGTKANSIETNLTFVALLGIEDPIRSEVPAAIQKCYTAGIDVRMVTGDSPNTAVSIAYQAGILKRELHFINPGGEMVASNLKDFVLLEGKAFRTAVYAKDDKDEDVFNQAAFDNIWPHLRVLARSSPDDKLTLAHGLNQSTLFENKSVVKKLSDEGIVVFPDRQVVAMTGDGTNDAPALKRADIGFAMGIAGTQIAKDAADIILLDDNFASIVTAAKWGRNVYASIQKFLQFQLTVNISAVFSALVGCFATGLPPLAATQLLWVNLLMDSLASLALASEPPVEELLLRSPVNRTDSMFTRHMITNMIGHAIYQIVIVNLILFMPEKFGLEKEWEKGSYHLTFIFNAFVWMQLFNEINCRKLKGEWNVFSGIHRNPFFVSILFGTAAAQVIIVQFGGKAFAVDLGGLKIHDWGYTVAIGAGSIPCQQIINGIFAFSTRANTVRKRKKRKLSVENDLIKRNMSLRSMRFSVRSGSKND